MKYFEDVESKKRYTNYKKRRQKRNSVGVLFLKFTIVFVLILTFALGGVSIGAYMGVIEGAPSLNTEDVVPEAYTSTIYNSEGTQIDKLYYQENREYSKLADIPVYLQHAVVAIEDERFYDHGGIDLRGIIRAGVTNIQAGTIIQGASTITQQLIKNEILTNDKSYIRKLKEQYLAMQIEDQLEEQLGSKKLAKNYILELYLNTIALNHGLNGVKTASEFYFGKSVSDLTLAECASLAGITKNPSLYSPVSNPEENKNRQTTVLSNMLEQGFITQNEYNEAIAEDIYETIANAGTTLAQDKSTHNYFIDSLIVQVIDDLQKYKNMSKEQASNLVYSGGLQIYSTLDQHIQSILEESYKNDALFPPTSGKLDVTYIISILNTETEKQEHITRETVVNGYRADTEATAFAESVKAELLDETHKFVADDLQIHDLQSAMSIMDFTTGQVKAIIGGRGEKKADLVFNRATQALRQPGSCFKVLAAYAPAIDLGLLTANSVIIDEPFTYQGWTPTNWYGGYRGASTVRAGIRDSMNILAAKTIVKVGVDKAYDYLINFGFTSLVEGVDSVAPAISLGGLTYGVSVLELTAAYATIANNGEYNRPIFYTKILDHKGNILLENNLEPRRVLKASTAATLTDMMEDVITAGTGTLARLSSVNMPVSGKTGTTNDDKDLTFAGYTPYYAAAIWLGYDQPKSISYSKSYHLLLWKDVMEKIHKDLPYKNFPKSEDVKIVGVCELSGDLAIAGVCDADYHGNHVSYVPENSSGVPTIRCSLHKSYTIDKTSGRIAHDGCPSNNVATIVLAIDPATKQILNEQGREFFNINALCHLHEDLTGTTDVEILDITQRDFLEDENLTEDEVVAGDSLGPPIEIPVVEEMAVPPPPIEVPPEPEPEPEPEPVVDEVINDGVGVFGAGIPSEEKENDDIQNIIPD